MTDCFKNHHLYKDLKGEITFISIHAPDGRIITYEVTSSNGWPVHDTHRFSYNYDKKNKHRGDV